MTSCPECGTSIAFQTNQNQCGQCGAFMVPQPGDIAMVEYDRPDQGEVREHMRAALNHAKTYYADQGQVMTWEETPTGANYYLDGEYAGEARFQDRPHSITEAIYITKSLKCPACKGALNATAHLDGEPVIPQTNDITVCAHCVTALAYTEHGGLRLTTQKEIDALSDDYREGIATLMRSLRVQKAAGVDTSKGLRGQRVQWEFENESE